jgi:hypothetical protein
MVVILLNIYRLFRFVVVLFIIYGLFTIVVNNLKFFGLLFGQVDLSLRLRNFP